MVLLCRHWHTLQGPSRQRSPTVWARPCCSQPVQGSVQHLEEGPLLAHPVGSPRPPACPDLPGVGGFPGLGTSSDRPGKALGPLGCVVSLSPRCSPAHEKLQLAPERGVGANCAKTLACGAHFRGGWAGGYGYTPATPPTKLTRGPTPAPRFLGSPHPPFGFGGHKLMQEKVRGSSKLCWESWC